MSPDPGAASGKIAGTQGDMEKADMVDGAFAQRDNYGALLVCPSMSYPVLPQPSSYDFSLPCYSRHKGKCVLGSTACC